MSVETLKERVRRQRDELPGMYGGIDFDLVPERLALGADDVSDYPAHVKLPRAALLADTELIDVMATATMLGDVVCAWLLLRGAEVALGKLGGELSPADKAFYEGKVAAASFFATNNLPKIAGERVIAESVDMSLMDRFRSPGYAVIDFAADPHRRLSDRFIALDLMKGKGRRMGMQTVLPRFNTARPQGPEAFADFTILNTAVHGQQCLKRMIAKRGRKADLFHSRSSRRVDIRLVLRFGLEKAEDLVDHPNNEKIREDLGVPVPLPDENHTLTQALLKAVFLRPEFRLASTRIALVRSPINRLDLEIAVSGYGAGRLHIAVVP